MDYTDKVTNIYKEGGEGVDFKDSKKPEELIGMLIEMATKKGDLVIDLYGGSGTTIACSVKTQRNCFTIEKNPKYVEIIEQRLKNIQEGKDFDSDKKKKEFSYEVIKNTQEWKNLQSLTNKFIKD